MFGFVWTRATVTDDMPVRSPRNITDGNEDERWTEMEMDI